SESLSAAPPALSAISPDQTCTRSSLKPIVSILSGDVGESKWHYKANEADIPGECLPRGKTRGPAPSELGNRPTGMDKESRGVTPIRRIGVPDWPRAGARPAVAAWRVRHAPERGCWPSLHPPGHSDPS